MLLNEEQKTQISEHLRQLLPSPQNPMGAPKVSDIDGSIEDTVNHFRLCCESLPPEIVFDPVSCAKACLHFHSAWRDRSNPFQLDMAHWLGFILPQVELKPGAAKTAIDRLSSADRSVTLPPCEAVRGLEAELQNAAAFRDLFASLRERQHTLHTLKLPSPNHERMDAMLAVCESGGRWPVRHMEFAVSERSSKQLLDFLGRAESLGLYSVRLTCDLTHGFDWVGFVDAYDRRRIPVQIVLPEDCSNYSYLQKRLDRSVSQHRQLLFADERPERSLFVEMNDGSASRVDVRQPSVKRQRPRLDVSQLSRDVEMQEAYEVNYEQAQEVQRTHEVEQEQQSQASGEAPKLATFKDFEGYVRDPDSDVSLKLKCSNSVELRRLWDAWHGTIRTYYKVPESLEGKVKRGRGDFVAEDRIAEFYTLYDQHPALYQATDCGTQSPFSEHDRHEVGREIQAMTVETMQFLARHPDEFRGGFDAESLPPGFRIENVEQYDRRRGSVQRKTLMYDGESIAARTAQAKRVLQEEDTRPAPLSIDAVEKIVESYPELKDAWQFLLGEGVYGGRTYDREAVLCFRKNVLALLKFDEPSRRVVIHKCFEGMSEYYCTGNPRPGPPVYEFRITDPGGIEHFDHEKFEWLCQHQADFVRSFGPETTGYDEARLPLYQPHSTALPRAFSALSAQYDRFGVRRLHLTGIGTLLNLVDQPEGTPVFKAFFLKNPVLSGRVVNLLRESTVQNWRAWYLLWHEYGEAGVNALLERWEKIPRKLFKQFDDAYLCHGVSYALFLINPEYKEALEKIIAMSDAERDWFLTLLKQHCEGRASADLPSLVETFMDFAAEMKSRGLRFYSPVTLEGARSMPVALKRMRAVMDAVHFTEAETQWRELGSLNWSHYGAIRVLQDAQTHERLGAENPHVVIDTRPYQLIVPELGGAADDPQFFGSIGGYREWLEVAASGRVYFSKPGYDGHKAPPPVFSKQTSDNNSVRYSVIKEAQFFRYILKQSDRYPLETYREMLRITQARYGSDVAAMSETVRERYYTTLFVLARATTGPRALEACPDPAEVVELWRQYDALMDMSDINKAGDQSAEASLTDHLDRIASGRNPTPLLACYGYLVAALRRIAASQPAYSPFSVQTMTKNTAMLQNIRWMKEAFMSGDEAVMEAYAKTSKFLTDTYYEHGSSTGSMTSFFAPLIPLFELHQGYLTERRDPIFLSAIQRYLFDNERDFKDDIVILRQHARPDVPRGQNPQHPKIKHGLDLLKHIIKKDDGLNVKNLLELVLALNEQDYPEEQEAWQQHVQSIVQQHFGEYFEPGFFDVLDHDATVEAIQAKIAEQFQNPARQNAVYAIIRRFNTPAQRFEHSRLLQSIRRLVGGMSQAQADQMLLMLGDDRLYQIAEGAAPRIQDMIALCDSLSKSGQSIVLLLYLNMAYRHGKDVPQNVLQRSEFFMTKMVAAINRQAKGLIEKDRFYEMAASWLVDQQGEVTDEDVDAFARMTTVIDHLVQRYPAVKPLFFDFIRYALHQSSENGLPPIVKQLNGLAAVMLNVDDENIVRALCYHAMDAGRDDFTFERMSQALTRSPFRDLSPIHQKGLLKAVMVLLNSDRPVTFDEINQCARLDQVALDQLIKMFDAPPVPNLSTALSWFRNNCVDHSYECFDKNPCRRDENNGFDIEFAKTQAGQFQGFDFDETGLDALDRIYGFSQKARGMATAEIKAELGRCFGGQYVRHSEARIAAYLPEYLYRTLGHEGHSFELNTTQYMAFYVSLMTGSHRVLQVDTGEGKSRLMMLSLAAEALRGQTVDFATSDMQLAQRDYQRYLPFFQALGIKCSLMYADSPFESYQMGGINFTDAANLSLLRNKALSEGELDRVLNRDASQRSLVHDEGDRSTYDSANQTYNYSSADNAELRGMEWVYSLMVEFFEDTVHQSLYYNDIDACNDQFMRFVRQRVSESDYFALKKVSKQQLEAWHDAAMSAMLLEYNIHFVVEPGVYIRTPRGPLVTSQARIIVNDRVSRSSKYSFGVQQCLHARLNRLKEKLDESTPLGRALASCPDDFHLETEKQIIASSSSKTLLDTYRDGRLFIATGTAGSDVERAEAGQLYAPPDTRSALHFVDVPRHLGLKRSDHAVQVEKDENAQYKAFVEAILHARAVGQPMMIVCEDDAESVALVARLQHDLQDVCGDALYHIHSETPPGEEQHHVDEVLGQPGNITITTKMLARGVDAKVHGAAKDVGLAVYMTYLERIRDEKQSLGRTGRYGADGHTRLILNAKRLKRRLGVRSLKGEGFYRNAEDCIRRHQVKMDRHHQVERLIRLSVTDLRSLFQSKFFAALPDIAEADQPGAMSAWKAFIAEFDQCWNQASVPLFAMLDDDAPDVEAIEGTLAAFKADMIARWKQFRDNYSALDLLADFELKPVIGDSAKRELQSPSVAFPVPRVKAVYDSYDPAHEGRVVRYTKPFMHIAAFISGKRQWFANTRRAWAGRPGVLFPYMRARLLRLRDTLRSWFGQSDKGQFVDVVELHQGRMPQGSARDINTQLKIVKVRMRDYDPSTASGHVHQQPLLDGTAVDSAGPGDVLTHSPVSA